MIKDRTDEKFSELRRSDFIDKRVKFWVIQMKRGSLLLCLGNLVQLKGKGHIVEVPKQKDIYCVIWNKS